MRNMWFGISNRFRKNRAKYLYTLLSTIAFLGLLATISYGIAECFSAPTSLYWGVAAMLVIGGVLLIVGYIMLLNSLWDWG